MAKLTAAKLKDQVMCDQVSRNVAGNFIFRRVFFYRHGMTSATFADNVAKQLTEAGFKFTQVNRGEVDKPFKGGSSVKQSSHWWVEIQFIGE